MRPDKIIPIAQQGSGEGCSGDEAFALMVLGDSMLPEFAEGEIIIIEPQGLARDGAFVLAYCNDEWIFRQLLRAGEAWRLVPQNSAYPEITLPDLAAVKGVIVQKAKPGRRRALKHYAD